MFHVPQGQLQDQIFEQFIRICFFFLSLELQLFPKSSISDVALYLGYSGLPSSSLLSGPPHSFLVPDQTICQFKALTSFDRCILCSSEKQIKTFFIKCNWSGTVYEISSHTDVTMLSNAFTFRDGTLGSFVLCHVQGSSILKRLH